MENRRNCYLLSVHYRFTGSLRASSPICTSEASLSRSVDRLAVDRFGAVVFPLRSPLIRSKLCPFFILATWIVAVAISSPYLFAKKLVESPERNLCVTKWKKVFGESSSRTSLLLAYIILFTYIPCAFVSHSSLQHLYQAQDTGTPR